MGGGQVPGVAGRAGPGRPVRGRTAGRPGQGQIACPAEEGADGAVIVAVGRGDHPHQRGPGPAGRTEPARREEHPAGPRPEDPGTAAGPGRRDGGPGARIRHPGRAARQGDPPAGAASQARQGGPAAGGRDSVRGAGGKALLRKRGNPAAAGLTGERWRAQWKSARRFLTADGEKDKAWGNETIRWNPDEGWLEIKLPVPLARLANRPHGRYRLSCPVAFAYRGDEVAAQAAGGAVRYDISYDPARGRWYIDASWKAAPPPGRSLEDMRQHPVLAVDLNHGHLAAWAVTPDGNPAGPPATIPIDLAGLPSATRDGRLRAAISSLTRLARQLGCQAVVIEDLDFADAREQGRERAGSRPSRGRRGRGFRRLVSGIPAGKFRDRLVQMTSNAGLAVIVVDPAYTSRWGRALARPSARPFLPGPRQWPPCGRRGDRQTCARPPGAAKDRCDRRRPEDQPPESYPGAPPARQTTRNGRPRQAQRQPPRWPKTATANRTSPPDQATQDRPGPPAAQDHVLLAQ